MCDHRINGYITEFAEMIRFCNILRPFTEYGIRIPCIVWNLQNFELLPKFFRQMPNFTRWQIMQKFCEHHTFKFKDMMDVPVPIRGSKEVTLTSN